MMSPKEADAAAPGAAGAKHERQAFSETDIVLLDTVVPPMKSTTQQHVLNALSAIHSELHPTQAHPAKDFDAYNLKLTDVGNVTRRDWLPLMNGKRKGKAKNFINDAHAERLMATLREFGRRGNDVVHYDISRQRGLVRKDVGEAVPAAGASAPASISPPAPPPPPLPDEPAPEDAGAAAEAEAEAEAEDSAEPGPAPPTRAPRCPWQPKGGGPCKSALHATCSHGACGQSHCALLQSRRGYSPCTVHVAPAG